MYEGMSIKLSIYTAQYEFGNIMLIIQESYKTIECYDSIIWYEGELYAHKGTCTYTVKS